MIEHIAHMGPMLILAGLAAGWIAETVARAGGRGFLPDLAVGLIGSIAAGTVMLGMVSREAGMPVILLVGGAGAALAIVAQRSIWRSVRLGT
jgi:uncharacterized membrane protein YeaQ/YmgE (transglycosylase-associated protein family)